MRHTDAPEQRTVYNSEPHSMAVHNDVQRLSVRNYQRTKRRRTSYRYRLRQRRKAERLIRYIKEKTCECRAGQGAV